MSTTYSIAQVGVGTVNPHESAILEIKSNSAGFLLPRLNNTQMMAINDPAQGLMVYCQDCCYDAPSLMVYSDTKWNNATNTCEACNETIDVFNLTDLTNMAFVIGQPDFVTADNPGSITANNLDDPYGIALDENSGKVFISDNRRNRVLRYASIGEFLNGDDAEYVFGQSNLTSNTSGSANNQLNRPRGLFIDSQGAIWINDTNNDRLIKHENASNVMVSARNPELILTNGINDPYFVAEDDFGTLWVTSNHQVVGFKNIHSISSNVTPDIVLGTTGGTSSTQLIAVRGVAVIKNDLYISDGGNDRVLRFEDVNTISSGDAADMVFFKSDFTTGNQTVPTTEANVNIPHSLSTDENGGIYIVDAGNHRVLYISNIDEKDSTAVADHVFGQPNFTSNSPGVSDVLINGPRALMLMELNGQKYVAIAERVNNRVSIYTSDKISINEGINGVPTSALSGVSLKSGGSVTFSIIEQPAIGNILTITDPTTGALTIDASGISVTNDEAHSFVYRISNEGGCNQDVEGIFFITNN